MGGKEVKEKENIKVVKARHQKEEKVSQEVIEINHSGKDN